MAQIQTPEEVHYLVRIGSWSVKDLEAWARWRESEATRCDEETYEEEIE